MKEGGGEDSHAGLRQPSPSEPASDPRYPSLSSRDAVEREGPRGRARLTARSLRRETGPLKWWAVPGVYRRARIARRLRQVVKRRGAGLMPSGSVWLGTLEWPEPEPRLPRQRSEGGSARRSRRRRARRPPSLAEVARMAAKSGGLVRPPPPPRDPVTQPEMWGGGGVRGLTNPYSLSSLGPAPPTWVGYQRSYVVPLGSGLNAFPCSWTVSSIRLRISTCLRRPRCSSRRHNT